MLTEFYDKNEVPEIDRIPLQKNILLVVDGPDSEDISEGLKGLELDRCEVAVTWPKGTVNLLAEIAASRAEVVVQVGRRFFKKFRHFSPQVGPSNEIKEVVLSEVADEYVILHHHDEYSIKDGLGTVKSLTKLLKAQRRSFCAITNHGSVGGWISQYNACQKAGVKAIFGMEAYTNSYRGDDIEERKKYRSANHLVLLARNMTGFENIIRIHNDAQVDGFYYVPRASREAMEKWGEGVIATSACMKGEIAQFLLGDEEEKALEVYEFYSKVFDEFYIELPIIEFEAQRECNRRLIQFAQKVGAPMVVACDSHYLEPEHAETHNILMCVRQHKTVMEQKESDDVWSFEVKNLYYRSADQMRELFKNGFVDSVGPRPAFEDDVFTEEVFEEAMANTRRIAAKTEAIKLDDSIKLPKLYPDSKRILKDKVNKGFTRRGLGGKPNSEDYFNRIRHEFKVITKLGWADYFLIMDKIVSDAIEEFGEWAIGYGRGSAAGSLVSYCLGLTDVDPIEHGLLFERFLDETRPTPPDIDTDFDPRIRESVKKRIVDAFGKDNVCSIGTYQTYKTRAVVLDVVRALGLDVFTANQVTKKIDPLKGFEDEEGEETKVDKLSFDEVCKHYPELGEYFDKNPEVRIHAEILRNQVKNMGTHAGGVIISDLNLKGRIPVLYDKPGSEERKIVSAWAEAGGNEELSSVGLVKFDILGLNNLPVVSDCIKLVEKNRGIILKRSDIPIDDREAIRMCSKKDLTGIFQLENPSTKPVADKVGLESLADVSALTSLLRPGPRSMGMDLEYAERKGGKPYHVPKPIQETLSETYGIITYQEQVQMIGQIIGNMTPSDSYKFLKACAKKIKTLMTSYKEKFVNGAQRFIDAGDMTAEEVEELWDLIAAFAGYGFNKSHAVTYSAISTVELWLKYNHMPEYCTALINNTKLGKKKHGSDNILVDYINYARRQGVDVRGPDVSKSKQEFTIEGDIVRFSLGHVKNVASQASVIESFQPMESVEDFHERVKVESVGKTGKKSSRRPNKKVVESLIAAGAFSDFGTRNEVMAEYYRCRKKKNETAPEHTDEEWIELEKEVMGMCLSQPPLYEQYTDLIEAGKWCLVGEVPNEDKKNITVFGRITSITPKTSKNGNPMFIVNLDDGLDSMSFYVFQGGQDFFRQNMREKMIVAMPMSRFDDGNMRFFNDRVEVTIIENPPKNNPPETQKEKEKKIQEKAESERRIPIWELSDGTLMFYRYGPGMEDGKKDPWYVDCDSAAIRKHISKPLTTDEEMLTLLKKIDDSCPRNAYDDVFTLYDIIPLKGKEDTLPSDGVRIMIDKMSKGYGEHSKLVFDLFSYTYSAMISEENKAESRAGKRIKLLGIYMVLRDGKSPEEVAKCMHRKPYGWIVEECSKRGI